MKNFHKTLLWIILLFSLGFTACSKDVNIYAEIMHSGRTRAEYLEDLDHLYYILRYNFPFWGVIYRRSGIDLHLLFENARQEIETINNIVIDVHFFMILENNIFRPVQGLGHLTILNEEGARWDLQLYGSMATIGMSSLFVYVDVFDNLESRWFYNLTDEDFIFEAVTMEELQAEYSYNIVTDILQEGQIAYLRIFQMNNHTVTVDQAILLGFFKKVADYEHLIVDIRGNPGGSSSFFPDLIISPNIGQTLNYNFYFFLPNHPHNLSFIAPRLMNFRPIIQNIIDRFNYINHYVVF